jgi:hypothetical protein
MIEEVMAYYEDEVPISASAATPAVAVKGLPRSVE